MENVQRRVMLLKPDAHIMGRWDSGATLRLSAIPGGVALSFKTDGHFTADGGVLTLFMQDNSVFPAEEITGPSLQTKISGVNLANVAGAAVIREDLFLLKSAGPDWPALIARYRFGHKQQSTAPEAAPEEAALQEPAAEPESALANATEAPPAQTETPVVADISTQQFDAIETAAEEAGLPPQATNDREADDECPHGIRQGHIDPFPGLFPGSEWVKISYPGPAGWWHYIFGRARVDGCDADVIGVPGEYSMAPPVWLDGFSTWIRCASGDARGYWLMFQDAQTGRVLDINRSRRGG